MLDIYSNLLEQNWTMTDIDNMDILYYFEVLTYRNSKGNEKEQDVYIDQIGWL